MHLVHLPVNPVLVDSLLDKFADDGVDFRLVRVEGEGTGIGHHSGVNAGRCVLVHQREESHAADEAENHLAGR